MESMSTGVRSRCHSGDQPQATTKTGRGPSGAEEAGVVELTEGSATTRTLVAAATDAADVTAFEGHKIAEVQLVYRTGQAAALLLPKYDCVDETNLLPSRSVLVAARETFIETNAFLPCFKKIGSSLKPPQKKTEKRITEPVSRQSPDMFMKDNCSTNDKFPYCSQLTDLFRERVPSAIQHHIYCTSIDEH